MQGICCDSRVKVLLAADMRRRCHQGILVSILLCLALPFSLNAEVLMVNSIIGDVVSISDGDTLKVLDESKVQHKIRLSGIDAPEKRQAFGNRARQGLAESVMHQRVTVLWGKRDRYGRIIGKVQLDGRDINLTMISAGLAWHYKAYEMEQSPAEREAYAAAEETARQAKVGLWKDRDPVPPWEFRKLGRRKSAEMPSTMEMSQQVSR